MVYFKNYSVNTSTNMRKMSIDTLALMNPLVFSGKKYSHLIAVFHSSYANMIQHAKFSIGTNIKSFAWVYLKPISCSKCRISQNYKPVVGKSMGTFSNYLLLPLDNPSDFPFGPCHRFSRKKT